jgi:hypothetical protein
MHRLTITTALVALFAAGCADAPAPSAAAPYARHRVAWQQFCEQAWNLQQASALAAARGAEGWELVAMYNGGLCYKRPAAGDPIVQRPAQQPPTSINPANPSVQVPRDPGF